jgi:hypothetical protein
MSTAVTVNGVARAVPVKDEKNYAAELAALLSSLCGLLATQFHFMVASGLTTSAVYARPSGAADSTEVFLHVTKAGKLSNLYVKGTSNAAGGSVTVTVRVAGADTALTCTVASGAATANDTSNTVSVTAGQTVSVKCLGNSGYTSGLANLGISFAFTPS